MSRRTSFGAFIFVSLLVVAVMAQQQDLPPGADPGWKSVQDAIQKGLPQTAIEELAPIIDRTLAAKDYDEAVKAIATRIMLEGNIQGNKPEEKITRMRAEIDKAPPPMQPVMEAILANWYWHYFQQNRWRFANRTQTDAPPSDDFTTWDLTRILDEIDKQFDKAFADADTLKATPVGDYDELLQKGTAPVSYRPTMFDVLAHNALEFYSAGEQAAARVQDAFDLTAASPIFSSRDDFVAWNPTTNDKDSLTLRAIELYQELLRFHAEDTDKSALIDTDLHRIEFGYNTAVGEEKIDRYKAALKRFEQAHANHAISTRALHSLAMTIHGEGDFLQAKQIAESAIARFPQSIGANRCRNLIADIEAPSASANTERVWNAPWPKIDVTYRNIEKVYFRLYAYDFQEFVRGSSWTPENRDVNERRQILSRAPVKSWSADLPKTEDYKQRVESVSVPQDVTPGSYYLVASHDQNFSDENQRLQLSEVWVSDLALVLRNHQGQGILEGIVLNAKSGQPIQEATVRGYQGTNRNNQLVALPATTTDANGLFRFAGGERNRFWVHVSHGGHSLSSNNPLNVNIHPDTADFRTQTNFFTDRAIYRPGQTIHYKGIAFSFHTSKDAYQTIARRAVTVVFADANGKEIERQQHQTNDYGSFSGSVTAPRDRLTGAMTLRIDNGPPGQAFVRVEEYKRPKFRVELDFPKQPAKLDAEVTIPGKATAYTGVPISEANVQWRVVREVRFPIWWYWSRWSFGPRGGDSQEIAHGTAVTNADGSFEVTFVAKPDASIDADSEPTFHYAIYADVTDTTGETRSDQTSVNVGYTSLKASMTAESWLTVDEPVKIAIRTTSLDGDGRSAKGTVKVYALKQPEPVIRASLGRHHDIPFDNPVGDNGLAAESQPPTSSDPNDWPLADELFSSDFATDGAGNATVQPRLAAGLFRAVLETRDEFGKEVKALLPLHVIDPDSNMFTAKIPNYVASKQTTLEPGETFTAIWGSGYESGRAYVEIEHRGEILQSYWTPAGQTQAVIRQEVTEELRGGFQFRVSFVRENRAYIHSQHIEVPWTNKELTVKWERFTSKLKPAQQETWTAIISGNDAARVAAEMVATLYDASLDAFTLHSWNSSFGVFRRDYSVIHSEFENVPRNVRVLVEIRQRSHHNGEITYPRFPDELVANFMGFGFPRRMMMRGMKGEMQMEAMAAPMAAAADASFGGVAESFAMKGGQVADSALIDFAEPEAAAADKLVAAADLTNVSARKNLNETAFFFPNLVAGEDGTVRIEFTMPEALTEWKFLGFAHTPELKAGLLRDTVVTSKELMVQPNPPRFLREGDEIEFTVKVSNRSATRQAGTVRLAISDARTTKSVDAQIGNSDSDKAFDLAAGESKSYSWRVNVADDMGFLIYKAVASSGRLSDGEEGFLPVLSKRVLVTESLALPIRGKQTKQFEFTKLKNSAESETLKHQSLTVQMVSNPSWYAVMALPYLMEYPHQCSEQVFNRLYANSLARHIATSDPKIERVFEQWRATPALDSPLTKNEELKSVMLEETPWYAEAQDESQARRNVGILFDQNRLQSETGRALAQLTQAQNDDGLWPWFPGGRSNEFISLYIATGFGRLRHLGVNVDTAPAVRSLDRLDAWISEIYARIDGDKRDKNHLSPLIALYLYGRSFFLEDKAIAGEHREAFDYWQSQARTYWLELANRQSQAHLAIALKRLGDIDSANMITASIRERSVTDDELGMFWRETELSWWWYRAPIETQAIMIELFDEVAGDREAVEACKVWLLKQKQTQDWRTTKATADAVYSLLLRGSNLLASDELVQVSLGGEVIKPVDVEAGTGFYEERFAGGDVQAVQSDIKVTKVDEGVAWGSVHWQYLEDIGEVTPHEGTPLKLTKQLFVKRNTPQGPTLSKMDGAVAVGDELVVRIVLNTDRDMEFVHMKDHRGSGTEPVNVLSHYKFQDGLAYYESTRDTASHFFIDYLPKGTYVFEYSTRVQLRGEYETGLATIQCMYAPEFNSHSESIGIVVQ